MSRISRVCVELYIWWSHLWQADDHITNRISAHCVKRGRARRGALGELSPGAGISRLGPHASLAPEPSRCSCGRLRCGRPRLGQGWRLIGCCALFFVLGVPLWIAGSGSTPSTTSRTCPRLCRARTSSSSTRTARCGPFTHSPAHGALVSGQQPQRVAQDLRTDLRARVAEEQSLVALHLGRGRAAERHAAAVRVLAAGDACSGLGWCPIVLAADPCCLATAVNRSVMQVAHTHMCARRNLVPRSTCPTSRAPTRAKRSTLSRRSGPTPPPPPPPSSQVRRRRPFAGGARLAASCFGTCSAALRALRALGARRERSRALPASRAPRRRLGYDAAAPPPRRQRHGPDCLLLGLGGAGTVCAVPGRVWLRPVLWRALAPHALPLPAADGAAGGRQPHQQAGEWWGRWCVRLDACLRPFGYLGWSPHQQAGACDDVLVWMHASVWVPQWPAAASASRWASWWASTLLTPWWGRSPAVRRVAFGPLGNQCIDLSSPTLTLLSSQLTAHS